MNVGRMETNNIPGAWDLYRNSSQLYTPLSRTEGIQSDNPFTGSTQTPLLLP